MASTYHIEDLTLDTGRQQILRNGREIALGPLTYKLLLVLVEKAPDLVPYDEIAKTVWAGRPASPETIKQRAKLLRDAIGDDAHSPRYIELVRGRGYRLIPGVTEDSAGPHVERRVARVAAVAIAVSLAAAALVWQYTGLPTSPAQRHSIAVLPFEDMSPGQDQQYFADGIAEEILNTLSTATQIPVIARTSSFSFRDQAEDIVAIGKKLDVSHVVEGSVRKSDERIRVTVQLVSATDRTHVWSANYDRGVVDMLQLQQEIAESVAGALEVKLLSRVPEAVSTPQSVNPEAYDLYLRGRQRLRDFELGDAKQLLERSLAIDPEFIPAYRHLGEAYVRGILDAQFPLTEYRDKLRDLVEQGLTRAPEDAALIALDGQLARYDGDIALAETRFLNALQREPLSVLVQIMYCMLKGDQGYPSACDSIMQNARELDPLNPLYYLGDWSRAMDRWNAEEALVATTRYEAVAAPTDPAAFSLRAGTKVIMLGDIAGGIRDWEKFLDIVTDGAAQSHAFPWAYYNLNDLEKGDAARKIYQNLRPSAHIDVFYEAYRYVVAGDVTQARELLLPLFIARTDFSASYADAIIARLAVDSLIEHGEPARAVEIIDLMAPNYATYRTLEHVDPRELSPAPYPVKSIYSSYPALYFPDYIRALRAAGNMAGAENMLNHLDGVLQWRRERGLFIEERHVAEARALRGDHEGALEALEQAELDRTIYHSWHVFVIHNPIFAGIRHDPRFMALVARIRQEMHRQRAALNAASSDRPQTSALRQERSANLSLPGRLVRARSGR